jgi:hypothetical protein
MAPHKEYASKPFNAPQNIRRLCYLEEINHPAGSSES